MGGMKRFLHDVADELGLDPDDPIAIEAAEVRLRSGDLPAVTQKRIDAQYLRNLSKKLMAIPVLYGTNQSDCDELLGIAARLS